MGGVHWHVYARIPTHLRDSLLPLSCSFANCLSMFAVCQATVQNPIRSDKFFICILNEDYYVRRKTRQKYKGATKIVSLKIDTSYV